MVHNRRSQGSPELVKGWKVTTVDDSAQALHNHPLGVDPHPEVRLNHVTRSALVLGSSQSDTVIDRAWAAAEGVDVARRRSGGGIVALRPGLETWIDVIVPSTSPLWSNDVGHAFHWLGALWATVVEELINPRPGSNTAAGDTPGSDRAPADRHDIRVHHGPLQGGVAGKLICFASLGPGEVTVEGRKVVGISQRRTRTAARFQSVVAWQWDAGLLRRCVTQRAWAEADLDPAEIPAGLGPVAPTNSDDEADWAGRTEPKSVENTFLAKLPAAF